MGLFDLLNDPGAESGPVLDTTRARQGVTGQNVRYVLAGGLAGVVIVFILAYFVVHALFA